MGAKVVEAYRLDRYDNKDSAVQRNFITVVEAYRLDRYDNKDSAVKRNFITVVEAYRLDRYDNFYTEASLCWKLSL